MKLEDIKLADLPHNAGARLVVIVGSVVISAAISAVGGMAWSAWQVRGLYDAMQEQGRIEATRQSGIETRMGAIEGAAKNTERHVGEINNDISFIAGQLHINLPRPRGDVVPDGMQRGEAVAPVAPPG